MLPALLLSIGVECSLVYAIFRKASYCYYVLLLNVLTNPLLNFIMLIYYNYIGITHYYTLLIALEIAVVIVEGLILAKLTNMIKSKALLVSLLLNAASYLVGVWVL